MVSLASIAVTVALLAGAPAPEPDVSLGIGWTVAQLRASAEAPQPAAEAAPEPAVAQRAEPAAQPSAAARPVPVAPPPPRVAVRPYAHHSDVDARIKEARRARALQIGAAMAVQGAMVIYGISRAFENAKEAEIYRNEPPPSQFKPMYPR